MTAKEYNLLKNPNYSRKLCCLAAAFLLLTCGLMIWQSFSQTIDTLSGSVVRLHILANSDGQEDQRVKLLVRDAVLKESAGWFSGEETGYQAEAILMEKIPLLEQTAERVLEGEGLSYPVSCTLEKTPFDTRVYEKFTLPAGIYDALTIKIGEAKGKNWWCMVYPELCIPPAVASEKEEIQTADPYFDSFTNYIITHPERFKVRFKTAELLQEFKEWCKELKEKLKGTDVAAEVE